MSLGACELKELESVERKDQDTNIYDDIDNSNKIPKGLLVNVLATSIKLKFDWLLTRSIQVFCIDIQGCGRLHWNASPKIETMNQVRMKQPKAPLTILGDVPIVDWKKNATTDNLVKQSVSMYNIFAA